MAMSVEDIGAKKIMVQALHKSATIFLYHFFKDVSKKANFYYFSVNNPIPDEKGYHKALKNPSTNACVCPIRYFYSERSQIFGTDVIIRVVRDPRDIMISEYYSFGWIHEIPLDQKKKEVFLERREFIQSCSIEQYVLHEAVLASIKKRFSPLLLGSNATSAHIITTTYDFMINDFENWAKKVTVPFGLNNDENLQGVITIHSSEFKEKVVPPHPDEIFSGHFRGHKRSVVGGEWKNFSETTKIGLENALKDELRFIESVRASEHVVPE